MLSRWFSRSPKSEAPSASGVTLCVLQKRLRRFTTEEVNVAMQQSWGMPYADGTFFATAFDEGAVIKVNSVVYPLVYHDRRLAAEELGNLPVPQWADHTSFCSIAAHFPGGVTGELRGTLWGMLSLLAIRLPLGDECFLFYQEDHVFVPLAAVRDPNLFFAKPFVPGSLPRANAA